MLIKAINPNHLNMKLRTSKKQFLQEIPEEAKGEFEKRFFLLLAMKYGYTRRSYLMEEDLEPNSLAAFNKDLQALIKGMPVQHIIGFCDFGGLKIKVDERALIPRPETEELLGICRALRPRASNAIDLATGSACLALGLKQNIEKVYALEKSPEALSLARENAELNDLCIEFIEDDLLRPQKNWPKNLDLIVSNPPYVRNLEKDAIEGEVLGYEPHMALFVADDQPLVFYQAIAKYAHKALRENGLLALEINQYLGTEMKDLLKAFFMEVELREDQFGNIRFAIAHKKRPTV